MANPDTPPQGFKEPPAVAAMFEAQEQWGQALIVFNGMVEQTRRAGFTRSQARALVAASLIQEVAASEFVRDRKDGDR
ncbi:hypothetical protein GCM10027294_53020 [Marinactinospora endophytica]